MAVLATEDIVSTREGFSGRPRIQGRRIAVANIAALHNGGWDAETISDELEITLAEVYAALSYYYSHKGEIDLSNAEATKLAQAQAKSLSDLLGKPTGGLETSFNLPADGVGENEELDWSDPASIEFLDLSEGT